GMFTRAEVTIDVLHDDYGGIDDDAEINRAYGQQVGRLAADKQHAESEQERQRDVDGHDQGAADVAQEHEQDHGHQHHAQDQVVAHGVGGDVDQVGAVVEGVDLHVGEHSPGRLVILLDLLPNVLEGRQGVRVLAQQNQALNGVLVGLPSFALGIEGPADADHAQPGLVADHHALLAQLVAVTDRTSLDEVCHLDGHVIDRGNDDFADFADAPLVLVAQVVGGLLGGLHAEDVLHRVAAGADITDRPDREGGAALGKEVAPGVAVAVG